MPPVFVAVIILPVPDCDSVTLSVRTPAVNAPDVVGLILPAFVVRSTVPAKDVWVLLNVSCAVMVALNAIPAVCGLLMVLMAKWCSAAGSTVKVLLVPVSVPPVLVTVIVFPVPAWVTDTLCVNCPLTNALDIEGLIVPAVVEKSTVPVKPVAVLPLASIAVIVKLID